jgi:REP element-mobilizing transposase RayT
MAIMDRKQGWLSEEFHAVFRELLVHSGAREAVCVPCYCLMPDHLHLMMCGLSDSSDQRKALRFLRRQSNRILSPHYQLQKQAHDHVLKDEERARDAFQSVAHYIFANPARAGLVREDEMFNWPYSGAIVAGYPDLHPSDDNYWKSFWKTYERINTFEG